MNDVHLPEILKPRWRGVIHQYAFFVAVILGAALVVAADGGRARIAALETTAERVERFRLVHEDAVRDLRQMIAQARASGYDHDAIDHAIRRARDSVRRFGRLASVE